MSYLLPLNHYRPLLDMSETEQGIKVIKEFFADNLSTALRLRRVTAPLFVLRGLGINDDLSGTERAVNFPIKDLGDARAEVVHSLAKWKRLTLAEYQIAEGIGQSPQPLCGPMGLGARNFTRKSHGRLLEADCSFDLCCYAAHRISGV